jgi:two-component system NtrC family sensor kinase
VNLSRNETKYCADVTMELATLPMARCWPGQITQVLVNLIVNAAHAIKGDGEGDRHGAITVRSRIDGGFAILEVADDGCGIPQEIASRVFDPFFTTKEPGRGTGLGLSLSYEIVERHRGEIHFESTVGRGTTFQVRVPIAGPGAEVAIHPARPRSSQNRELLNS